MIRLIEDVLKRVSTTEIQVISSHTRVTRLNCGIYLFEPLNKTCQRDVIISSGIHGNEAAPIELCERLINLIFEESIVLNQRLLLIVGNPLALIRGERQVDYNLNRLFYGVDNKVENHDSGRFGYEGERVEQVKKAVAAFFTQVDNNERPRYHLDLHCSIRRSHYPFFAIHPYCQDSRVDHDWLYFIEQAGVQATIFSNEATNTFSFFTHTYHHCQSMTVELGHAAPLGRNNLVDLSIVLQQLINLISKTTLLMPATWREYSASQMHFFTVAKTIIKNSAQFEFLFKDDVKNFTIFHKGCSVYKDQQYLECVKDKPVYIVFPNKNVQIGQRAGLLLNRLQ
ncbi:succinylglutamate desuccinylase [Algibacillus agarilyticus]|uniref:succinylglutamate desuccinylase n=1 Tax=Algibacillus agarilyticus TaxID=2234133 RepID=UPI000DCFCE6B|nr:succinylglutamate desuccinylase [Algibacillus agarilyticus]